MTDDQAGQQPLSRGTILPWLFVILAAGMTIAFLVSTRRDALFGDALTYFEYSVTFLFCAGVCIPFIRRRRGVLRARWLLFAFGAVFDSVAFLIAALTQWNLVTNSQAQIYLVFFRALSSTIFLLAITLFFSQASRTMAALDGLQAVLFGILHLSLVFDPQEHDLFTNHHLAISTAIATFLALTSFTALLGAGTLGERRFLRLLSVFLALQAVSCFFSNQISYAWMHHPYASEWDLAETLSNLAFAWLLLHTARHHAKKNVEQSQPTRFIRNLMPSVVTMGNVALGLLLVMTHTIGAACALFASITLYILRTVLLQSQSGLEREKLYQLTRELEQLATADALTGVGNRRSLMSAIATMSSAERESSFALALIDTDWFKQANDHHGHLYGDQVLIAISRVLHAAALRTPHGHCARLGGDEFALLLPGMDALSASELAEEIRRCVRELGLYAGERTISVSVGCTVARNTDELPFEVLMRRADEALYRAKSLGRDRVELWSDGEDRTGVVLQDHSATA